MDLPHGSIVLRSGFSPYNWLLVDPNNNYKLSASATDSDSATRFMAEPVAPLNNGRFALRAMDIDSPERFGGWLSRIHWSNNNTDYLEATKSDIDVHGTFQYYEVQPKGRLFAISLPLDTEKFWRLDDGDDNLIKPDASIDWQAGNLWSHKRSLFSYEYVEL